MRESRVPSGSPGAPKDPPRNTNVWSNLELENRQVEDTVVSLRRDLGTATFTTTAHWGQGHATK